MGKKKDLLYIAWKESFLWEGCPLCFLIEKSIRNSVEHFLYENINDPKLREIIRKNNGLCERHFLQLLSFQDLLGTSILLEDLTKNVILPSLKSSAIPQIKQCIFCEKEREYENLHISKLEEILEDPEDFKFWKEKAYSFCIPHMEKIKNSIHQNLWEKMEPILSDKPKKYPEYLYGTFHWKQNHAEFFLKKIRILDSKKK